MKKWISTSSYKYFVSIVFCLAVILGIISKIIFGVGFSLDPKWLIIGLVFILMSFIRMRRFGLIFIFLAGLMIGGYRVSVYQNDRVNFSRYYRQNVKLVGEVSDDVSYGPEGEIRFKLKNIKINHDNLKGEVWASSRQNVSIKRSDVISAVGFLGEGFGGFSASYTNVLINKIDKNSNNDIGLVVRDDFAEATYDIDDPGRQLGLGFLLGQKNDLPEDLQKKIKNLGLSHMIVASGYNLTILVVFTRRIFEKISKYLSVISGAIMIGGFMLITGFSPSMSRAGLVAGLSLIAWYYGRKVHPVSLLLITATATLLIKPSYIWGDMGWYLSFFAFIGVLILTPLVNQFYWGNIGPSKIRELVITTLCAQIMTLPILIHSFGLFSPLSLLANILILPIVPLAMLAVFVAGLSGLTIGFVSEIFSFPANLLLKYCIFVIDKISSIPNSVGEATLGTNTMIMSYVLILILIVILKYKTKYSFIDNKNIID